MTTAVVIKNTTQRGVKKTTVHEIVTGILAQKDVLNLTNQQIADLSNISKSTVDRVLRDDPDNNPTAQCLFDIADAVGYKIGKQTEEDPSIQRIVDLYETHARQTALQQERQGKLIHRLLLALVGVLLFLFIMLLIDMVSPTGGWVRS
jgi:transcriptional regulator with XRE-family HTH domain